MLFLSITILAKVRIGAATLQITAADGTSARDSVMVSVARESVIASVNSLTQETAGANGHQY